MRGGLDNLENSDRLFTVMNTPIFKKQPSKVIDNLYVAYDGDKAVGMVHRPKNTRTDKNFWRCYVGIGESARFLGHARNRRDAENHVAWAYCMMNATVAESDLPEIPSTTEYFLEGLTA